VTATAKVIQRLEVSSGITPGPIPDCAALMMITRFAPYRPELHYMRGPGPRWHVKNDPRTPPLNGVLGGFKDVNGRRCTSKY
jgi:hypothetical protein